MHCALCACELPTPSSLTCKLLESQDLWNAMAPAEAGRDGVAIIHPMLSDSCTKLAKLQAARAGGGGGVRAKDEASNGT